MHGLHISDRARTEYMNLILGPFNKYPSDRLLIKTPIFRIYDISRNNEKFLLTFQIKQHTDFFFYTFQVYSALTDTMDKVYFYFIPILIRFLEGKGQWELFWSYGVHRLVRPFVSSSVNILHFWLLS